MLINIGFAYCSGLVIVGTACNEFFDSPRPFTAKNIKLFSFFSSIYILLPIDLLLGSTSVLLIGSTPSRLYSP
jgi:hypothetical protein